MKTRLLLLVMAVIPLSSCAHKTAEAPNDGSIQALESTPAPAEKVAVQADVPGLKIGGKGTIFLGGTSSTSAKIDALIQAQGPAFSACRNKVEASADQLSGSFEVKFVVEGPGVVSKTTVRDNTSIPDSVAECVCAEIASIQLPPTMGSNVTVIYPFAFSPIN